MTTPKRRRARGNPFAAPRSRARSKATSRGASGYTLWIALVIAVASLAMYWRTLSQPFLNYDDPIYVTENQRVQAGLTGTTITWALTATDAANWFHATWISHALDCELYGLEPAGHHASSVILHALNSVLVSCFSSAQPGNALLVLFLLPHSPCTHSM